MELRPYQKAVVKQTYQFYRSGLRSVLLYAPTGAGKTAIASRMIADAVGRSKRCLFLCHRTKLISQTTNTLQLHYGIESGIIWADTPTNYDAPVQIAMVQSIQNRELPKDIRLVVIDECHTTAYYKIITKIFDHYSNGILPLSPCYFLGLSATPWRTKQKEGYCQFFQALARAPHPEQLIKMGFLSYARHYGWGGLADFSQLDTGSNGDFSQASMQKVCNEELNTTVVEKFLELCPDRKAIAFCASVKQAEDLAKQFNAEGIVTEVVTGNTTEDTRSGIYQRFKSGVTQIISSVSCLCEGFDETSCDAALLVRPTKSRTLLIQMCGRALRLHPGKDDALLLDFCENFKRLGISTKPYSTPLCPSYKDDFFPTKECPQCHAAVPQFTQVCPECGYEFSEDKQLGLQLGNEELEFGEILSPEQKQQLSYLRSHLLKAFKSGKDYGRVAWLFWRKYDYMPPSHWYLNAIFRRPQNIHLAQRKADIEVFKQYLKTSRPNPPKRWLGDMMRREFGSGFYNLDPLNWWEVLEVPCIPDWEKIKAGYQEKIAMADEGTAALLNFAFDEGREFCRVMSVKAV